jgi:hypothetical protein
VSNWSKVRSDAVLLASDSDALLSDILGLSHSTWSQHAAPPDIADFVEAPLIPASPWSRVAASVAPVLALETSEELGIVIRYDGAQTRKKRGRPRISTTWGLPLGDSDAPLLAIANPYPNLRPKTTSVQPRSLPIIVPCAALSSLRRPSIRGVAAPHPLETALGKLWHSAASDAMLVADEEMLKVAARKLDVADEPAVSTSLQALSEILQVPPEQIKLNTRRLACLKHWHGRTCRGKFEHLITRQCMTYELLEYIDMARHDETPMDVRISAPPRACGPSRGNAADAVIDARPQAILMLSSFLIGDCAGLESKLLQSEHKWAMLLERRGSFFHVRSKAVCELQMLEDTTAATIAESQARISQVTVHANKFQMKTRAACTDKFSANFDAERRVVRSRGHGWLSDHRPCFVHVRATCHTITLGKLELKDDVSGLVRAVLGMRKGKEFIVFKRCAREVLRSRIRLLRGAPPEWTMRHRRNVINTFVSGDGDKRAITRSLLALLPNGDWTQDEFVDVYFELFGFLVIDLEAILDVVVDGLMAALFSSPAKLYVRHRWTGADVAVDEFSIMEAISRLLTHIYERFVSEVSASSRAISAAAARVANQDGDHLPDTGRQLVPVDSSNVASKPSETDKSAEAGDFNRREGLRYLKSRPFPRLVVIRVGLEVLQFMTTSQFYLDSEQFERDQRAEVVKAMRSNGAILPRREYKITVMAKGMIEAQAFQKLSVAFDIEGVWSAVAGPDRNNRLRCLAFRYLSRIGASIEELACAPNREVSNRIYLLLHLPELWDSLRTTPPCLFKDAANKLIGEFRDEPIVTEKLLSKLEFNALERDVSIAPLEAKHASIRRLIMVRSLQTHKLDFKDLNAEWLCSRFRLWNAQTRTDRKHAAVKMRAKRKTKEDLLPT